MKNIIKFLVLACAFAFGSSAFADVGAGLKIGTLGVGLDFAVSVPGVNPANASLRFNGNYFSYSRSERLSRIDVDGDLKLQTFGVIADWYPFSGSFRLSAGGYANSNRIDVTGKATAGGFSLNNVDYTTGQVGTLTGRAKIGTNFVPYVGLGWGNPLGESKRWGAFCDFGVLFTGSPQLALASRGGTLSSDPVLLSNLDSERRKAQKDVSFADVYPVISVGLTYKF